MLYNMQILNSSLGCYSRNYCPNAEGNAIAQEIIPYRCIRNCFERKQPNRPGRCKISN